MVVRHEEEDDNARSRRYDVTEDQASLGHNPIDDPQQNFSVAEEWWSNGLWWMRRGGRVGVAVGWIAGLSTLCCRLGNLTSAHLLSL